MSKRMCLFRDKELDKVTCLCDAVIKRISREVEVEIWMCKQRRLRKGRGMWTREHEKELFERQMRKVELRWWAHEHAN
jgi:hypothetical protein